MNFKYFGEGVFTASAHHLARRLSLRFKKDKR